MCSLQTLRFDVEDYDKFTDNDFLGRAAINLSTVSLTFMIA